MNLDFLPLKSYSNIVEGNALGMDWNSVVPKEKLNYIMGNPPFVGARLMGAEQKADIEEIFAGWKNRGNLDYVSCWYKKTADFIKGTEIRAALVSTNSITQGDSVAILWKPLFAEGVHIDFAHRTFRWDSESNSKAHVHCVIVGFSTARQTEAKRLYSGEQVSVAQNINGYLLDAPTVWIEARKKPICDVPEIVFGNMPNDSGYLSDYTDKARDAIVSRYPSAEKIFRRFVGAQEFLHGKIRWCLWLKDIPIAKIKGVPPVYEAVQKVREIRLASNRAGTRKMGDYPTLFGEIRQPEGNYLIVPRHSSEHRKYIPLGYMSPDVICGDSNLMIPDVSLYHFGVLTSNVHMAWMRAVAGRLEMRYRYSKDIVYNNFPWPSPTDRQKAAIEEAAKAILAARETEPDASLADLYDDALMPAVLRKAHQANDRAVMEAYGFYGKGMTEAACVAELMKMYQSLVGKDSP